MIGMRRTFLIAGLVTAGHILVLSLWQIDPAANHPASVLTAALVTLPEETPAALPVRSPSPSPDPANATTPNRPRPDLQALPRSPVATTATPEPLTPAAQPALPAAASPPPSPAPAIATAPGHLPSPATLPAATLLPADSAPSAPAAKPTTAPSRTVGGAADAGVVMATGGSSEPTASNRVELPSSQADYLNNAKPPYPPLSRRLGEQGQVLVRVLIGADGVAQKAEVKQSSGFERLDQAALSAAMRWRYLPGRRGGVPEAMWFTVPISFALN
jgi:protein TonB